MKKAKSKVKKSQKIGQIDLKIDYRTTLNELTPSQIGRFYRTFYTPIKIHCALHNFLAKNVDNKSVCADIESKIDAEIESMNQWLARQFKNA